ncbi:hypothetical protein SS1G_12009 [Sclerotinia sclerotiorum 1980 UF-70]|uniref:Uncharacterized protein n=1 Tax=Sclerotinia sclerotiorum (strain ATCC 18683 / 1980 / Ss-1) TaxID=665079 RepID=A7F413_SCLS1|nr:hypothetical protein SS1G_12009 [Sclerotinia sclerotiorum 1980 UF-70]EDN97484.1 hypothetical protein SS1G_12009 [Sclerotinia sclerotiorum 1980 UF-70]
MVPPYLFHNLHRGSMSETLEPKEHGRFSEFLNKLLHALSRPSSSIPFGSMFHNWHAQTVLLSLANRTKPPLTIDRLGYHSVQAVLLATQKTNEESRLANLQARGWPPWRVDQDGMDAQRSSDEDMSRVVFAIRQMKEAGYNTNLRTHVHHILGGQEDDGTPTIHTRSMSKAHIRKLRSLEKSSPLNPRVWSARIVATRDVQEAWSAFKNFHRLGGTPTSSIYHAMMEKIEAENRRTGRFRAVDVLPGQGKEVLPPFSDNFSDFYKEELRPPPTIDVMKLALYMPSSRYFAGVRINLYHKLLHNLIFQCLVMTKGIMKNVQISSTASTRMGYKPTWYAVLDALARPGIIIDPNIIGDPQDDVNSWRISAAVLQDFHDAGLELDPKGFQLICRCLEKAMLASFRMVEKQTFADAILLVKEEFAKISSTSSKFEFSVLPHKLHGAILHAYVRVLGLAEDLDGLKAVVDWMVLHHNSLLTEAKWTRNGYELLRRTLTATKVFCKGTPYEEEVRELVESVDGWTWPTDEDARGYIEAGPLIESGDGSLVIDEHDEKNLTRMP